MEERIRRMQAGAALKRLKNPGIKRITCSHTVRTGDGATVTLQKYTMRTAITAMCMECLGHEGDPRTDCTSPLCPLYPFRRYSRKTLKVTP